LITLVVPPATVTVTVSLKMSVPLLRTSSAPFTTNVVLLLREMTLPVRTSLVPNDTLDPARTSVA